MTENFSEAEIRIMKQLGTFDLKRDSLYGIVRDWDELEASLDSLRVEGYVSFNEKKKLYSLTDAGRKLWNGVMHTDRDQPEKMEWNPEPDSDAFLLETKDRISYFYAIKADLKLNGKGNFFYKESQDGELVPSSEEEVLDILRHRQDEIEHRCPCLTIMPNGHLKPIIDRSGVKQ